MACETFSAEAVLECQQLWNESALVSLAIGLRYAGKASAYPFEALPEDFCGVGRRAYIEYVYICLGDHDGGAP